MRYSASGSLLAFLLVGYGMAPEYESVMVSPHLDEEGNSNERERAFSNVRGKGEVFGLGQYVPSWPSQCCTKTRCDAREQVHERIHECT
jgi:hypothetical protein